MSLSRLLLIAISSILFSACDNDSGAPSPNTLHLTWCDDPTTTMRAQWLHEITDGDKFAPPVIQLRRAEESEWTTLEGFSDPFPVVQAVRQHQYGENPRIHRVEMSGLTPDTEYEFRIEPHDTIRRFRTAPSDLRNPIRFAIGGDIDVTSDARAIHRETARQKPLFAVIGGDISYADGVDTSRKITWLQEWSRYMVADELRHIPMLAAIGNHEVQGGVIDPALTHQDMRERAPFFLSVFGCQFSQKSYSTIDIGNYMTLFLLDTDHLSPVGGDQRDWLQSELASRHSVRYLLPVYHVAAYPSVRPFENRIASRVRAQWVPLFESEGVRIAFEHHEHAYKRTWPLLSGEPAGANGVTYVGDGAWGAELRTPSTPEARHYLRVTERAHHIAIVEIDDQGTMKVEVRRANGRIIDDFSILH